jgi:hypothetical protein
VKRFKNILTDFQRSKKRQNLKRLAGKILRGNNTNAQLQEAVPSPSPKKM